MKTFLAIFAPLAIIAAFVIAYILGNKPKSAPADTGTGVINQTGGNVNIETGGTPRPVIDDDLTSFNLGNLSPQDVNHIISSRPEPGQGNQQGR